MQSASDIFLGWMTGPGGRHFYWRQLWDMKGSIEVENLTAVEMQSYATICYWALARAHARSGDAIEIASYLGASATFDRALASFADSYADQNERDYQAFLTAIKSGRLTAATAG
jgi:predicted alpha/beta hydrolase